MASINRQIHLEILPFIRVYNDGSVDRLLESPSVPPSQEDLQTGVSSKDIIIPQNPRISARLFLPKLSGHHRQKLPILVYFHGGGFCFESAFSLHHTKYLNTLVSQAKVVAISVEYRLAPQHLLPAAYEDCWTCLQWAASLSLCNDHNEPWLLEHGDFDRLFIGGDSAGANIAHKMAMQAGVEGLPNGVTIKGAFLTHPYFWGSQAEAKNSVKGEKTIVHRFWDFVWPSTAKVGIDSPLLNPSADGGLAQLGCRKLLVTVAEMDMLRDAGVCYYESVKGSGWKGDIELIEVKQEDHAFQVLNCESQNSRDLIEKLVTFLLT